MYMLCQMLFELQIALGGHKPCYNDDSARRGARGEPLAPPWATAAAAVGPGG